jgi:hypothetical protein
VSASIGISKLDVAKRELEHSIKLFFLSGDPVVLHLVVSSCQQIFHDLCKHKNIDYFLKIALQMVKTEKRSLVSFKFKEAYNFFKHANRDPKKVIEFHPESNQYIIWECIDIYYSLTKETTGLMQAYRAWFYMRFSDLLLETTDKETFRKLAQDFDLDNKYQFLELALVLENKRTGI